MWGNLTTFLGESWQTTFEHLIYNDYGLCHMKKLNKKKTHTDHIFFFYMKQETHNLFYMDLKILSLLGQNQIFL